MSELKRIDGKGCGGCYGCRKFKDTYYYCNTPISIRTSVDWKFVRFTHNVIENLNERLPDCPLERDDD